MKGMEGVWVGVGEGGVYLVSFWEFLEGYEGYGRGGW